MRFTRLNGHTVHYRARRAEPGAPTIVFVNSLGTDLRIWDAVTERLEAHWGFLVYDKRGHGLSGMGSLPYSMEALAGDLAALMDGLGTGPSVICGLSVGGMIAQALSAERPDLVQALMLCDTAHRIGTHESWTARITTVDQSGLDAVASAVMPFWFTPAFRTPDNAEYEGCIAMLARQPPEGYKATCVAIQDADLTDVARRISVPTLCVVGDSDGSTPPDLVRGLADLISGSRFQVIQGAAHIPNVERPDAFHAILAEFVARIQSGSTVS